MAAKLKQKAMTRNAGWNLYLHLYRDKAKTIPFVMTGYQALCQFRAKEGDSSSALLATATITVGTMDANKMFSPDPAGNTLLLSLAQADIAAVPQDEMFADVLIKADGSDPSRKAYFKAVIGNGESVWPTT